MGIDFLCPDISISYKKQKTALLEANSRPHLDMHQFPSHRAPEPIAKKIWDTLLEHLCFKETEGADNILNLKTQKSKIQNPK